MSLALCFWILMIVSLVFNLWTGGPFSLNRSGPTLLLFVLLALLGWAVFGAAIKT